MIIVILVFLETKMKIVEILLIMRVTKVIRVWKDLSSSNLQSPEPRNAPLA